MHNHVFVILGTETDPHIARVKSLMEKKDNIETFVFDYHSKTKFAIHLTECGNLRISVNGKLIPEKFLVWDRRKIIPGTELYIRGDDDTAAGYAAQEWRALYTLICGLNKGRVINSLESRCCMIKPYQQMIASAAGFTTPPTIITNDRKSALEFQHACNFNIIMKSVSAGKVKPASDGGENIPYNVMTMRVEKDDLNSITDEEIGYCPHFFQEEIKKDYELRIIVVGNRIIPFRINSQKRRTTEVDWRKGIHLIEFERCNITDDLACKLNNFMNFFGLFSGSIDIVVDKTGNPWFLECNQDGAWGWLDDIAGGEISQAFTDEIYSKVTSL